MTAHADLKEHELAHLATEKEKNSQLFVQGTFIEDPSVLAEFGIYIPGKEECPTGLIKLWPEDFIVEERTHEGVCTVGKEENKTIPEVAPTIYATLVKCGLSTLEAIEEITKLSDLSPEQIAYAGMKDKDAITAQRISLRKISPDILPSLYSPHFFLKDFEGSKGATQKGNLIGNRFTILIRTTSEFFKEEVSERVLQRLEIIEKQGFYNFFYLQRFGTPRLCNFAWARLILQGNYREALLHFLCDEGERELPYFRNLRKKLRNNFGNWEEIQKIIAPFPIIFRHEHKVIGHLVTHKEDYVGAFQTIPEQITIWMYALASLLFNQKISDCLIAGKEPPPNLPFFLSPERNDWEPYKEMLSNLGIYPPPFKNIRSFPQIILRKRETPTISQVKIHKAEVVKEGIVIEFELGKGQYATTFLSHLFNLIFGIPPPSISNNRIDVKEKIKEEPLKPLLKYFERVIDQSANDIERGIGES